MKKDALFGGNVNAPVVASLRVADVAPDPNQPRKFFDQPAIKELAVTIKEKGLIQPIIVRTNPEGDGYIIIAGERRWRAVQVNGSETIDAVVRDDLDARACALIENVQRENLKPMEEAEAISTLIEDEGMTQADVANILGMGRVSVTQLLKIRSLPDEIKAESITLNTSKSMLIELCSISDEKIITKLWNRSKNEALSIADIRRVRDKAKTSKKNAEEEIELSAQEKAIRKAFDALESLKDKPLSEAERARLIELQAKVSALLDI
jgi:ParB family chromosome partitioning protein